MEREDLIDPLHYGTLRQMLKRYGGKMGRPDRLWCSTYGRTPLRITWRTPAPSLLRGSERGHRRARGH